MAGGRRLRSANTTPTTAAITTTTTTIQTQLGKPLLELLEGPVPFVKEMETPVGPPLTVTLPIEGLGV